MTIYDFNEIGKYIAKKTNKDTFFHTAIGKIENEDFKHILLFNYTCCIKHKDDKSKIIRQYKTYNGAIRYINKWIKGE